MDILCIIVVQKEERDGFDKAFVDVNVQILCEKDAHQLTETLHWKQVKKTDGWNITVKGWKDEKAVFTQKFLILQDVGNTNTQSEQEMVGLVLILYDKSMRSA